MTTDAIVRALRELADAIERGDDGAVPSDRPTRRVPRKPSDVRVDDMRKGTRWQ